MEAFADYLAAIENPQHRVKMEEVLGWVADKFPTLATKLAWNQPMFTDHGTFIIGFSVSKNHMAVAPEPAALLHFADEIKLAGYETTKGLIRIAWDGPFDYALLEKIIAFNIKEKADCTTFWRK